MKGTKYGIESYSDEKKSLFRRAECGPFLRKKKLPKGKFERTKFPQGFLKSLA